MEFNFAEALRTVPTGSIFRAINSATPSGSYLFATLLPEVKKSDYQAKSGNMRVIATMAALVGMDSPYPQGGTVEISDFSEETAKIAIETTLKEQQLRQVQQFVREVGDRLRANLSTVTPLDALVEEVFNFNDKLLVQPHLDRTEWMRGRALFMGQLDWTFNGKRLLVDYGFKAANVLPQRTGTDAYHGSTSKFWGDVKLLRRRLNDNVRAFIAHPDTLDAIANNPANSLVVTNKVITGLTTTYTLRRVNNLGNFSVDAGDTVDIITYRGEASVYDPANPTKTIKVSFAVRGVLLAIGNSDDNGYIIGNGGTELPTNILGYTHIAPTTEGNGISGRWGEVYTPQNAPWSLSGRSAGNVLPVIECVDLIARSSTEMPA